jgi:hypothetical protein
MNFSICGPILFKQFQVKNIKHHHIELLGLMMETSSGND